MKRHADFMLMNALKQIGVRVSKLERQINTFSYQCLLVNHENYTCLVKKNYIKKSRFSIRHDLINKNKTVKPKFLNELGFTASYVVL